MADHRCSRPGARRSEGGRLNILVTGAAGFIGSHLCEAFLARGDTVTGIDNLTTGRIGNVPAGVIPSWWDIADGVNGRYDLIAHCAASYADPTNWERDTRTNVQGTIEVLRCAQRTGARVLYFQTSLPPISSYAISKIAGQQYIEQSGVPHTVFRLANIYGPRNVSGPVPAFWKRITNGQPCTVASTRRDMVYITDLVDGVLRAVDRGTDGVIDMCSGGTTSILELFHAVDWETGGQAEHTLIPKGADDVDKMELDPTRALTELNWFPRVPLEDGVKSAVQWYDQNGVDQTYTHLKEAGFASR